MQVDGELLLVSQFTLYYRYKGTNLDFSKVVPQVSAFVRDLGFRVQGFRIEERECNIAYIYPPTARPPKSSVLIACGGFVPVGR